LSTLPAQVDAHQRPGATTAEHPRIKHLVMPGRSSVLIDVLKTAAE
jgi:hypothetical protein